MRTYFASSLVVMGLAVLVACSSDAMHGLNSQEDISQRFDSIVGGHKDKGTAYDNVVAVFAQQPNSTHAELCTGTLISENVVLTARHCVTKSKKDVTCHNDVISDYPLDWLSVVSGIDAIHSDSTLGTAVKVFSDGSKNLCGHDIALIVLDTKVSTIQPRRVRVAHGPNKGERFRAIGFGLTDPYDGHSSGVRYYRDNVKVLGYAPDTGEADFMGTESICSGDSGGPAIAKSGAVFGVTSRGGGCYADDNIWTRTDKFKWLIDKAIAYAGGTYTGEDGTKYGNVGGSGGSGGAGGSSAGGSGGSGGSAGGSGGSGGSAGGSGGSGGSAGGSGGNGGSAGGSGGSGHGNVGLPGGPCGPNDKCQQGAVCVVDPLGDKYCTVSCSAEIPDCPLNFTCKMDWGACIKSDQCSAEDNSCAQGRVCVDDGEQYCAPLCNTDGSCPDGYHCVENAEPDRNVCFRQEQQQASDEVESGGDTFDCSVSQERPSAPWGWFSLIAVGAALLLRRYHDD